MVLPFFLVTNRAFLYESSGQSSSSKFVESFGFGFRYFVATRNRDRVQYPAKYIKSLLFGDGDEGELCVLVQPGQIHQEHQARHNGEHSHGKQGTIW